VKLKVLFFGPARILTHESEIEFEIPSGSTVQQAVDLILHRYSKLKEISNSLRYALDEEYAQGPMQIRDGQTLAVIPPVQGG
jgi:molybdopterin converting factor small subunit